MHAAWPPMKPLSRPVGYDAAWLPDLRMADARELVQVDVPHLGPTTTPAGARLSLGRPALSAINQSRPPPKRSEAKLGQDLSRVGALQTGSRRSPRLAVCP
jgi:hypothetical protein